MCERHLFGLPSSDAALLRVSVAGLAALIFLGGCATALKRESRCLASLTPEIVQAKEEMANLEASWHDSLGRRDAVFGQTAAPFGSLAGRVGRVVWIGENPQQEQARLAAAQAYQRLAEAKARHRPLLGMYDKVYQRVRTRTDEEEILSEVRMVLLAGPASLVFYPIIRWNVRSVLWDGADPDAESDPVTRFCADRLMNEAT